MRYTGVGSTGARFFCLPAPFPFIHFFRIFTKRCAMASATILFPHQLFEHNPATAKDRKIYLVEEFLFFQQYAFHKQKLAFHRASMKYYESWLQNRGMEVEYIESHSELSDVRKLLSYLKRQSIDHVHYVDPADDWLHQRITSLAGKEKLALIRHESPLFMNSRQDIEQYFKSKKAFRQTDFYKKQRKKWDVLIDEDGKPRGGQWTYDTENRKRYPKNQSPPEVIFPTDNRFYKEARSYVEKHFASNYGTLDAGMVYPIEFDEVRWWLDRFLEERFSGFGTYQDALVADEHWLHHSLLSPMLNTGLITPGEVIDRTLEYASDHPVPLNALEGFIRQILGWREFIRGVYEVKGRQQRSTNFWGFSRKIPSSFWQATTGVEPVDKVITKVLETGYAHHIERLMVLGNFMLLCELDPDEVYRWFMELFIDAYDWVMVPNVYGMSQFADGGLMSGKPYISSSNYLMKMGDYSKGSWQNTWDALFWRFMNVHRDFFQKNPRMGMLIRTYDKMPQEKKKYLMSEAGEYLANLV